MFFARSEASLGWKRIQEQPGAVEDAGGTQESMKELLRNIRSQIKSLNPSEKYPPQSVDAAVWPHLEEF